MVQHIALAVLYSALLISCLSDNLVYTFNGYQDERDNIIQRRPTMRTENDNLIIETPRNRNITLSPGSGGFVKIGNTIIDPNSASYQNTQQQIVQPPQEASATDILAALKSEGVDLRGMLQDMRALREQVQELEKYSLKGTYPALFEFYNNQYGVRYNSNIEYGQSGLMVMTEAGGILFGQHISAPGLESGTSYAITFYLSSHQATEIDVQIAGSDHTELYINDVKDVNCGNDAIFTPCRLNIPSGDFKLTLLCWDTQDVLESIGFRANWLTFNNLSIDWTNLNRVLRNSPDKRRKK